MQKILVAIDGSEPAWKALEVAGDLARAEDAAVIVVHVLPREPMPSGLRAFAQAEGIPVEEQAGRWHTERLLGDAIGREARDRLAARGIQKVTTMVEEGAPAPVILDLAKAEAVDAIVMGSRGRGGLASALLGSVAQKVANGAGCTCIIVR